MKLNFSSEREQSQACLNSAEHEKNQGRKVLNLGHQRSIISNYICTPSKLRITMTTKTIREIALAWKSDKQRYVKQSTYAAYVLVWRITFCHRLAIVML